LGGGGRYWKHGGGIERVESRKDEKRGKIRVQEWRGQRVGKMIREGKLWQRTEEGRDKEKMIADGK
jgi:hypothetical protein